MCNPAEVYLFPPYRRQHLNVKPMSNNSVSQEHFSIKASKWTEYCACWNISCPFPHKKHYICELNAEISIVTLERVCLIHVLISLVLTGFLTLREINSCDIFLQRMCCQWAWPKASEHINIPQVVYLSSIKWLG